MDKVSSVLPSSQVRTIVVSHALKRCMIAKFGQASYGEVTFAITRRCLYISSGNYGKSLFWVTISTAFLHPPYSILLKGLINIDLYYIRIH
jgi:hypothetical protein